MDEKKLTPEELQRTQVLNLKDVEEVARFEKRTSKKPAVFLALIGVCFFIFGISFQMATVKPTPTYQKRKTEVKKIEEKELLCSKEAQNTDGTASTYTIKYNFKDQKLTNFIKSYILKTTEDNALGMATIESYITAYQPYLLSIRGYEVSVIPNSIKTELSVNTVVDLKTLDMTNFPEFQQSHFSTKIDYLLDENITKVINDMQQEQFICK